MAFRIVFFGWFVGLGAAVAAYAALDAAVLTSLGVWSATGTLAFLLATWSLALRDDCASDAGMRRLPALA
jgi:hypothetical protein